MDEVKFNIQLEHRNRPHNCRSRFGKTLADDNFQNINGKLHSCKFIEEYQFNLISCKKVYFNIYK